jgi:RNA polymerase sigma-70 factor, ECF subfamily
MRTPESDVEMALDRYRSYLRLLAEAQLGRDGRRGVEPSDVVQQTLLDAHKDRAGFRGACEAEHLAWLRRLLACNLADALRAMGRVKRDVGRVRSLEASLGESSARLERWLAVDQSSPSQRAERNESLVRLADALVRLPEDNRRALVMRHCQGACLAEISEVLGRTPQAVAGLLKRGLAQLRDDMPDDEGGAR